MNGRFAVVRDGVDRVAQIVLGDGVGVLPIIIDTAFVLENPMPIEDEAMRCTERSVGTRHFLAFIVAVRERKALFIMALFHGFKGIVGIVRRIVAVDQHKLHSLLIEMILQLDQSIFIRPGIRTVVAGEDDDDHRIFDHLRIDRHTIGRRQCECRHWITDA